MSVMLMYVLVGIYGFVAMLMLWGMVLIPYVDYNVVKIDGGKTRAEWDIHHQQFVAETWSIPPVKPDGMMEVYTQRSESSRGVSMVNATKLLLDTGLDIAHDREDYEAVVYQIEHQNHPEAAASPKVSSLSIDRNTKMEWPANNIYHNFCVGHGWEESIGWESNGTIAIKIGCIDESEGALIVFEHDRYDYDQMTAMIRNHTMNYNDKAVKIHQDHVNFHLTTLDMSKADSLRYQSSEGAYNENNINIFPYTQKTSGKDCVIRNWQETRDDGIHGMRTIQCEGEKERNV